MKYLKSMLMISLALTSFLAIGSGQETVRLATKVKAQQLSIFSVDEIEKYRDNPSVEQKASAANYTIPLRQEGEDLRVPAKILLKKIVLGATAIMGNKELKGDQKIAELNALHAAYMNIGLAPPSYEALNPGEKLAQLAISSEVGVLIIKQTQDQVWNQVSPQIWDQVSPYFWRQIWCQVLAQICGQVSAKLCRQISAKVWRQISVKISPLVEDRFWTQVWLQLKEQVSDQVSAQIQVILSKIDFGLAFAVGDLRATLKPEIHCVFSIYLLGHYVMCHAPQMAMIRTDLASKQDEKASLEFLLNFRIPKSDNYLINAQWNILSASIIHTAEDRI